MMEWGSRFSTPPGVGRLNFRDVRSLSSDRFFLLVFVVLFFSSFNFHSKRSLAQENLRRPAELSEVSESPASFLQVGEELLYKVKYWFIGLGEVRVRVTDAYRKNGSMRYRAEVFVDSYSGNPFVNLHQFYETEFDSALYSHYFYGRWLDDDIWKYVKYYFLYNENKVIIERGKENPHVFEGYDTTEIDRRYQDGLSLFYFARGFVKSGKKSVIPTFINEKKGKTYFNFLQRLTDEEIDTVEYPIEVVEFEGEADWVGIFGLTGGFRGWFSNDQARIPILARMKVIIGSVKISLQSWKRDGWTPPRYIEEDD